MRMSSGHLGLSPSFAGKGVGTGCMVAHGPPGPLPRTTDQRTCGLVWKLKKSCTAFLLPDSTFCSFSFWSFTLSTMVEKSISIDSVAALKRPMPLPFRSAAVNGRLMPPNLDTSSSGNVDLASFSLADLSTSANSEAFFAVASTLVVSSAAPTTAASAALLRSLMPPPAKPSAAPMPAVNRARMNTFERPFFWAATNSSSISILRTCGAACTGMDCGANAAPYGFDASTRGTAAAWGTDANGGAGTRLGLGTGAEGRGVPTAAGGGTEPTGGVGTVFFPRRDFRSILGLFSIGDSSLTVTNCWK